MLLYLFSFLLRPHYVKIIIGKNVEANKNWEIDASAIEILEVIGRGAFADVHKGTLYGMDVAIKKLYVHASEKIVNKQNHYYSTNSKR